MQNIISPKSIPGRRSGGNGGGRKEGVVWCCQVAVTSPPHSYATDVHHKKYKHFPFFNIHLKIICKSKVQLLTIPLTAVCLIGQWQHTSVERIK